MTILYARVLEAKKKLDDKLSTLVITRKYKTLDCNQLTKLIDILLPYGYYTPWQKYIKEVCDYYMAEYPKAGDPELLEQLKSAGTYMESQAVCG